MRGVDLLIRNQDFRLINFWTKKAGEKSSFLFFICQSHGGHEHGGPTFTKYNC